MINYLTYAFEHVVNESAYKMFGLAPLSSQPATITSKLPSEAPLEIPPILCALAAIKADSEACFTIDIFDPFIILLYSVFAVDSHEALVPIAN